MQIVLQTFCVKSPPHAPPLPLSLFFRGEYTPVNGVIYVFVIEPLCCQQLVHRSIVVGSFITLRYNTLNNFLLDSSSRLRNSALETRIWIRNIVTTFCFLRLHLYVFWVGLVSSRDRQCARKDAYQ